MSAIGKGRGAPARMKQYQPPQWQRRNPRKEVAVDKPNREVIEMCEDLLGRARSGVLESLAVVEFREGDRMTAKFSRMDRDTALTASTFLGMVVGQTFLQTGEDGD